MVYPLVSHGGYFTPEDGWEIKGWANAPYPNRFGGEIKAIVFEKTTPSVESVLDALSELEPGIYWCHGDIEILDCRAK